MGAANVLGNVAAGIHQAYETEQSRQFADEMDRRRQIGEMLTKLVGDETARPETRQAAAQSFIEMHQTPYHKAWKFDPAKLIAPRTAPQTNASFTPGATPGTVQPPIPQPTPPPDIAGQSVPQGMTGAGPTLPPSAMPAPQGPPVSQVTPGQEAGLFKTPDVIAAEHAHAAGTAVSAQMTAQIDARNKVFDQNYHELTQQGVPEAEAQREAMVKSALAVGHPLPYSMMKPAVSTVHVFDPKDPNKQSVVPAVRIFNPMDQSVEYRGPDGQPIVDPQIPPPGWTVPKTTTKSGTDALGFKTSSTSKTSVAQPTPPPGGETGTTAKPAASAKPAGSTSTKSPTGVAPATPTQGRALKVYNGLTDTGKSAVDSAADGFIRYGWKPGTKLDKTQSLAEQILKEQGVDIPTMATAGAMGQADVAKMIQPLITRARELIAANPEALGPLAGRWSELSQKFGNLSGPPKELAGTLTSIYSLAGKLHGWRAIKVADEFRKTYGDLSNTPESLNSGLDAMLGTTKAIIGVAYPGGPTAPPTTPHPATHVFDSKAWATANPNGDVNAAIAAAKAQNYEVK